MAEDIPKTESPVQHEMTANPNILIEAKEGQTDAVNVLDDTSSIRTIALEPPNASSSEQVTLQEPILN